MIRELVRMVEQELGTAMSAESRIRVETAMCRQYGGEQHYLPKQPKQQTVLRIVALGTGIPAVEAARQIGVTPQYVRKIRRIMRG
jgi:DNA-binding CsgD family transcriptional regulator